MDLLSTVASSLERGERLSDELALALFASSDLVGLGQLAEQANRRVNGDQVFYNVNRHINPTNICALSCKFCAYSRKPGEEGAYAYSIEEMVVKAGEAVAQGATEVHMVGGLHPRWRFEHYKDMVAAVKTAYPQVHIKAFTAVELDWLARRARKTVEQVLLELQAVGLGSLPGGGAEIFHPDIRDQICDTKLTAEQWIDTHRTAHRLGMHSNCTMLYGHIETFAHRVDHMRRLRELQDETHGFNAFIPLSFQPFQNELGIDRYTYGYDDLKTIAIARLYLDNFRHIKAYWVMLGQDIAQVALQFGANDLDGTVIEEKISRMAGGRAGMAMGRSFIEQVIAKAKRVPVERDTLYNPVSAPRSPTPALDAGKQLQLRQTLAKADYGERLVLSELLLLAQHASLHELGRLAQGVRELDQDRAKDGACTPAVTWSFAGATGIGAGIQSLTAQIDACRATYQLQPEVIAIDLTPAPGRGEGQGEPDVGLLVEFLFACRHSFPAMELSLLGIKGLWRMAQQARVQMPDLLQRLVEAGLSSVESSAGERETDLTHGEISTLHRQMHRAGLFTVAKVELSTPTHGPGEPHWESYLKRVLALADLSGQQLALSVEASAGSLVTTSEYLRAVALARLASPAQVTIIAPLMRMPTLSPKTGLGTAQSHQPAEKIAALCLHYGASELGAIAVDKLNPIAVLEQIRAAAFQPQVQARGPGQSALTKAPVAIRDGLRHVPQLR